jgi:hypothetical protein
MWYFGRSGEPTFVDKAPNASGFARSTATLLMRGYVWGRRTLWGRRIIDV